MSQQALAGRWCRIAAIVTVGLGLAWGPLPSIRAAQAEQRREPVEASETLEFRAADGLADPSFHRKLVLRRAASALEGRAPLDSRDRIVVNLDGGPLDYHLTVVALRDGGELPEQVALLDCGCSTTEMLAKVDGLVAEAATKLEAAAEQEREQLAAQLEAQQEQERQAAAEEQARLDLEAERAALAAKPYRPERLGLYGAVGTGLGGGLLITGAALTGVGDNHSAPNLRQPGTALLGAGAVILSVGLTMLVTDVLRCRKDRVRCGGRKGAFARRWGHPGSAAVLRW